MLVKLIEMININWWSVVGVFKYDGIVLFMFYKWFIGMWVWDLWKVDVVMVDFNFELVKNNMWVLFDY